MKSPQTMAGSSPAESPSPSAARIPLTPLERGWKPRPYSILDEVLGPDFHGPSSSHTAAPQAIAHYAYRKLGGVPDVAAVKLINSFATTGEGHRTHVAVTAGLLGLPTVDPRTRRALELASEARLHVDFEKKLDAGAHPNTIILILSRGAIRFYLKAISIGGGNFEIVEEERAFETAPWRRL